MLQLQSCHNPDLSEEQYFSVIQQKTAGLFEAACKIPALLNDSYHPFQSSLQNYGKYIGFAFQIIDDALDYSSETKIMGKNPGDDLAEGKMTLPLIYALAHANKADQAFIRTTIETGSIDHFEKIKAIIDETKALPYTLNKAEEFAQKAKTALQILPDSAYKNALLELADITVKRNH